MIKKVLIGFLLILCAIVGGAIYAIPFMIDKEGMKAEIATAFKSLTGLEVEIQGEAVIERFPTPHVVVNSMYVHNAQGGVAPFLLTVKVVEIWPSYRSLTTKHPTIQKILIDDVDLEIERLKNGTMNFRDNTVQTSEPTSVSKFTADASSGLMGARIELTNGYLHYADAIAGTASEYKDISINFLNGGIQSETTLDLALHYRDKALRVAGKIGNIAHALSAGEVPATLMITSGKSELNYSGNAGYRDGKPFVNGSVKYSTDDIISWMNTIMATSDNEQVDSTAFKPLPLALKSDIVTENGKIIFPNMKLEGDVISGDSHMELTLPYGIDINGDIKTLNLETLFGSKLFDLRANAADALKEALSSKESTFVLTQKSFYEMLNLTADVKVDDMTYNQQHIKDGHVNLDMTNGEMTISQAVATLPGDARVIFAGIGKEGYQGFALEGEVDATGANFAEAIKVMKANGASYPVDDFKRFRLKANALLSAKELRLSEIAARIEDMAFVGGFIATFGDRIRIDAAMRAGGINLDHFIEIWGIQEWRTSLFDTTPGAKHDSFLARWLRRLDYDTAVSLSMEQFTLNHNVREKAEMKLKMTSGKVTLDDIKTSYNGSNITGNFLLDVTSTLPKIEIKATLDKFDTDSFFTDDGKAPTATPAVAPGAAPAAPVIPPPPSPQAASPSAGGDNTAIQISDNASPQPAGPRWSHEKFDFHWLELLTATFHVHFGDYKQGLLTAHSLDVLGSIDNQMLTIEALTGYVQGAQVAAKSNILGGAIPSIKVAANVNSLDPTQLVPFLPLLQGMTGKYNISLGLDASGIDLNSWMSSLEGSIGVGGETVDIHGFNLAGVIHSVSYVRTVADILNVVRRAFPGGDTMFSNIEGQWTVASGVLKTANSKLTNEQADGVLKCQVDLVNWLVEANINLSLKSLDPAHPPGMVITFNGNLDHPDIALDTRSLEQYVTNKTSERMLQEYGTQ